MRGVVRPVSVARKLIIEFMHASVPLVVVKRTMNLERLVKARATQDKRPGWTAIIAKAYCIVARDEPWLRTFYLKFPWPHFYEVPKSIATVTIIRNDLGEEVTIPVKIGSADEMALTHLESIIQRAKTAPLNDERSLKRIWSLGRMPLPLRRLIITLGLNVGRHRANYFGTLAITSLASLGVETVVLRSPGPAFITYGWIQPDHTMELLFHWDHRIYDGSLAARALRRLEHTLNNDIANELLASGAQHSPPV